MIKTFFEKSAHIRTILSQFEYCFKSTNQKQEMQPNPIQPSPDQKKTNAI